MLGTRGLWAVVLVAVSCGCANTRLASSVDSELSIARANPSPIEEPVPSRANGSRHESLVSFASPEAPSLLGLERAQPRPDESDASRWASAPRRARRSVDLSGIEAPTLAPRAIVPLSGPPAGCALVRLGTLFELEFCAGTEPQEADTVGYWEEFHFGRTQDQRLDLSWRWRKALGTALVGSLGSPRRLDQELAEAILDADEVFVSVGMLFSW